MFTKRVLKRITCGIYEAIGSIQLQFSDGVQTQQFGTNTGQQLNCSLEVPEGEIVTTVKIRHRSTTASIQNITFITDQGSEIEFSGKLNDGKWTECKL